MRNAGWLGPVFDVLLLAVVACFMSYVAWIVFPVWDDSATLEFSRNGRPNSLWETQQDRPLIAATWQWLSDRDALWSASLVIHALAWFGLSVVTYALWITVFPERREQAVVASILAVTPVVVQTQFVWLNPAWSGLLGPVLCTAGCLLLMNTTADQIPKVRRFLVAGTLIAVAVLISEYGVPTAVAMTLVLCTREWRTGGSMRPSNLSSAAFILFAAVAAYLVYHATADAATRQGVRPELLSADELRWRLRVLPFRLITTTWQALAGRGLTAAGHITATNKMQIVTAGGAFIFTVGLWTTRLRKTNAEFAVLDHIGRRTAVLAAAVFIGMIPMVLMGRIPTEVDRFTSRFWLPIMPLAACGTIAMVNWLSYGRTRTLMLSLLVAAACFALVDEARQAVTERKLAVDWGKALHDYVTTGEPTVVVFDLSGVEYSQVPRDYELTIRLGDAWTPAERRLFWAFASSAQAAVYVDLGSGRVLREAGPTTIERRNIRTLFKEHKRVRLLHAYPSAEGGLTVLSSP